MADNNENKVLNVPPLRFPEFSGEWERKRFRDVCNITTGNKNTQDKSDDGIYPFYVRSQIVERINSWTFDGEAILTAGDGVGVGKVFHYSTGKIGVHQRVYILSDFKCDGKYLYSYFAGHFYNRVKRMSAKNSVDSVRMEMIADMPISLPSTEEQKKIGHLLALLDERIATQNKIIEDLKKLKSAIVDRLYSSINGETYSFHQLFEVANEKNKKLVYKSVLSASQELGMIERSDINIDIKFEQESISGYKIVRKGDYVVHLRSFQGGFAFSDRTGICSPAYTILRPNDLVGYGYLSHFFTSKLFIKSLKLVTYGIRDGRSINVDEWLNMTVTLPNIQEQVRILTIINAIDVKLHIEIKKQSCLFRQKSYLLNTMFI
jgi:type I restriction enzyme S subunit